MTNEEYINQAMITNSIKFYPECLSVTEFFYAVKNFETYAKLIDSCKKSLFYGNEKHLTYYNCSKLTNFANNIEESVKIKLIHAMLGLASESGEITSNILNAIENGNSPDFVNLKEELGDIFWFIALICDTFGWTFEEIQEKNIAKLRTRYPNGFNSYDALNRNLEKENNVLSLEQIFEEIYDLSFEEMQILNEMHVKYTIACANAVKSGNALSEPPPKFYGSILFKDEFERKNKKQQYLDFKLKNITISKEEIENAKVQK